MRETMDDYPALRMEDDGFLLSMRMDFADRREELFGATGELPFLDTIERLVEGNSAVTDVGSQLPLHIPVFSDDGMMVGSKAVPVWSGTHVGFPLYPGLANDSVESFLYGNPRRFGQLGPEFMSCDPAFRLALLVHFALENVIIHELAVEAFLLGTYDELPLPDEHYQATGLPSTELFWVQSSTGLRLKRSMPAIGELCIAHGVSRTDGWIVRVRGAQPKERVLRDCWQEIRSRNEVAHTPFFVIDGKEYATARLGLDGRSRKRSGSPAVDYMVAWVDALEAKEGLPMHGTRTDWVGINRRFEVDNPQYVGFWSADTMRRTYGRRKRS